MISSLKLVLLAMVTIIAFVWNHASAQESALTGGSQSGTPKAELSTALTTQGAVPEPHQNDRYQATWNKNPFLAPTNPPPPGPSIGDEWDLKGLFKRGEITTILLGSKKDPSLFKRVGPEPDAEGFKLLGASPNRNRREIKVIVAQGPRQETLSFAEVPAPPAGIAPSSPTQRRRMLIPSPVAPTKP